MAITNVTRNVSLTTQYLNHPLTQGITANGHWFYYVPANAGNTTLGANIVPYQWGSPLPLVNSQSNLPIPGTIPLLQETWEGSTKQYHGSSIEWIGAGRNDITNTLESDAFFFGHLSALSAVGQSGDDDAFYWDRVFLDQNGTEWDFYQYHLHLPLSYATYENGRITLSGNGYIVPADKSFAYMIQTRAKVGPTTYSSVTARIHTPSIGGAHNSHNDVNLPAVAGFNYLAGGIIKGNSDRYHALYLRANGSNWDVFIRTYTNAAKSFGIEANIGTFDLADPLFNPTGNVQQQYPLRPSCGTILGTRFYFPVIFNNATSGFDLKIWSLTSSDNVAGGSLVQHTIATGLSQKPDCMLLTVGDILYALFTDVSNGGVRLYKYTDSMGTWTDVGSVVSNVNTNYVRIHGFKYNPVDVKFYALLSGTSNLSGSYVGPGMYSFQLTGTFSGYSHLDYDKNSNSFLVKDPLETGYLSYTHVDSTLKKYTTQEPQGIATGTSVLQYNNPSPKFYNKNQYALKSDSYYFQGIKLSDGRKILAGQVENNAENLGLQGSGDFLVTLVSDNNEDVHHFAWGGTGDDYITGMKQDGDKVWITGYTKSELVQKRDIKIHGWCRTLSDGGNAMKWADMTKDSEGNIYLVGPHITNQYIVAAKYDYNYNLIWQKIIDGGNTGDDIAYGIALDSSSNVYITGSTVNNGIGNTDVLLVKLTSAGVPVFNKIYGTVGGSEYASSIAIITKNTTQYAVISVISGTNTIFLVTDTSGNIVEQNTVSNLIVNRIKNNITTPAAGRYLFTGNDGAGATKAAKFGMCEILSATRCVQWVRTYSGGASASQANDIVNIDAASDGVGAGYIVVGSETTNSLIVKVSVDESAGNYTVTKTWAKNFASQSGQFMSVFTSPYTDATKYIYVSGYSTMTMDLMTHDYSHIVKYDTSGNILWQNKFGMGGHMNERFVTSMPDVLNENIIVAGYTESHHTMGTEGVLLRVENNGFGTGAYHLEENPSIGYTYAATINSAATNNNSLTIITAPVNSSASLTSVTNGSLSVTTGPFSSNIYDGSYGDNGVFMFFIGYIDLPKIQDYFNSEEHKQTIRDSSLNSGNIIYYTNSIFKFYQVATVGDGTADDGNIFGYDIIKHSNGSFYCIGQTSGDVSKTNTGASGVYDYLLVEFDPITEKFEYYQNGTSLDEETYALTELSNGKIAYVGRTSGDLGGPLVGNYDIFLGIFDTNTEVSTYHNTGSGLDDKGVAVHDIGNNELIITYSSYGTISGTTNYGSEDIGGIKFNYSNNTWGTAYQAGSATSELFNQNGSPSCVVGNKLIIVTNTAGIFADNQDTFGYLDVGVGVLDFSTPTGSWKKYQIGSEASDTSTSVYADGQRIIITGYTDATLVDTSNGFFLEFDISEGFGALSSTPDV